MLSVFLDANVIYSITLTDVLLTLAEHDLFLPLWSPNVLQEAQEAASRTLPDAAQQAFRKRLIMMDQAFPESSIHVEESEWSQFDLPDPDGSSRTCGCGTGTSRRTGHAQYQGFSPEAA